MDNTKKTCSDCNVIKNIDCFNKNKTRPDGYEYGCRDCRNILNRQYYHDHKEDMNEKTKLFNIKNKDKRKITRKHYNDKKKLEKLNA